MNQAPTQQSINRGLMNQAPTQQSINRGFDESSAYIDHKSLDIF
jgi:hypothetical protein